MNALIFLVETFARLYLMTFLLRIILQLIRADFYNPISQFIVRVTNPLVVPARRMLPRTRHIDMPTLIVLVLLQVIVTLALFAMSGVAPRADIVIWAVIMRLVELVIGTYLICIFIYVILSWVAQASYSPFAMFLGQIVEPVLRPARRILPTLGGLDISPMIVMILLYALSIAIRDLIPIFM